MSWPAARGLRPVAGVLVGPVSPGTWRLARADRRRISLSYGQEIAPALLPERLPGQPLIGAQRSWRRSSAAWRLASYQVVRLPACAAAAFVP